MIIAILVIALNIYSPDNTMAIPAGSDCAYTLMDMGYRGIAGDGAEQIYAPVNVIAEVCS